MESEGEETLDLTLRRPLLGGSLDGALSPWFVDEEPPVGLFVVVRCADLRGVHAETGQVMRVTLVTEWAEAPGWDDLLCEIDSASPTPALVGSMVAAWLYRHRTLVSSSRLYAARPGSESMHSVSSFEALYDLALPPS